jgi:phosphoribosylanthranilate isomerase
MTQRRAGTARHGGGVVAAGPAVKICGVCTPADAALAGTAGAAYVGVILAPGRSRSCTATQASAIFRATRAKRVGVFVDAAPEAVAEAVRALGLDVVQLHGEEPPEAVERLAGGLHAVERLAGGLHAVERLAGGLAPVELWKAVRVRSAQDIRTAAARYAAVVHGLLLDGWSADAHGGTGAAFDWAASAAVRGELPPRLKVVVAGGLRPDNVASAVRLLRPDVVDVSSGVEEEPCRKSAERVHAFIAAARGTAGHG